MTYASLEQRMAAAYPAMLPPFRPKEDAPVSLGLCIPHGLKPYLSHFDAMPGPLREFILSRTKQCDGCRYCVQTDRQGTRPLACVPVRHQGAEYSLCPLVPGYGYSWTDLDDALADNLIAFLTFMDSHAPA